MKRSTRSKREVPRGVRNSKVRRQDKFRRRDDQRYFISDLAEEEERAANSGQMKEVYVITKEMCNEPFRNIEIMEGEDGEVLSAKILTLEDGLTGLSEMHEELNMNVNTIRKEEIKSVLKDTKNGNAPVNDNIRIELLNDTTITV